MKLTFSPVRSDAALTLERSGDTLIVNGVAHDFTDLKNGEIRPADEIDAAVFAGIATRRRGVLHLCVSLPLAADAPRAARFPAPMKVPDGPVTLPGAHA